MSGPAFETSGGPAVGYDYNDRSEVIAAHRTLGATPTDPSSPPAITFGYDFDPIGNRMQATDWDSSAGVSQTTTYATNALNQYTSLTIGSTTPINIQYDLDGNLINDGLHQLTYDAENRLTSVTPLTPTAGSKRVEVAYDYMSRRTQKTVSTYDGSSWVLETETFFIYDGWNLIQEQTTAGGNTSTEYYVWGLDLSGTLQGAGGIGGLLSKTNSLTSKTFLYTVDANGNMGQLVESSTGTIAAHYEYDPFGNLVVSTGSEAESNVFWFSTKYYDAEVGLYNYGYRYYDPVLGRWRTRDPIGEEASHNFIQQYLLSEIDSRILSHEIQNLYAFVRNNPIIKRVIHG